MKHTFMTKMSSGECSALVTYSIDHDKCTGCSLCARKCPVDAISGQIKSPYTIDSEICIKCGDCYKVCRFDAVKIN